MMVRGCLQRADVPHKVLLQKPLPGNGAMQTSKQRYRVDRRQISFIKFIFEAYDGVAVVTTLDADSGLISIAMAPGCEGIAKDVMDDLSQTILIERVDPAIGSHAIK